MKTQSKLSLFVLVLVAIIAASCKGKPGSGTGSDSGTSSGSSSGSGAAASGTVSDSKRAGVIDSLGITDPEEKKLCVLYDEAISEYIKQIELVAADTSRLKTFRDSAFDKKFTEESKKLEPEMKRYSEHLRTSPVELMKFEKFSVYETQRLMPAVAKYQKIILKNYLPK
jgi:hypothetical protein